MRKTRTNRADLRREISSLLGKVSFSQTAVRLCEQKAVAPQEEFFLWILKSELANRDEVRRARFLEGFDFTSVKLPPSLSREELCSGACIAEKKNLVLYGPVGTGKTHLASALGVLACSKGLRTRFFTAAELVVRLSEAFAAGSLEKLLKNLLRADLVIIDEWGYVPVDRQGAQLLFRIISDSDERRSIILTTNLEFSKWGAIFTDDQMAAAMIDRLAHHGYILLFEGESYRMKHALMRQRGQAKIPTN